MVLGTPTTGSPAALELVGYTERVLSADDNQSLHPQLTHRVEDPALSVFIAVGIGPAGPENRAAAGEDAPYRSDVERHRVALQRPPPPISESHELVTVDLDPFAYHRPDDRIQPRAVAATGQHADSHDDERTQDQLRYTACRPITVAGRVRYRIDAAPSD